MTDAPREGVPPCFRMAVLDDRRVLMHDVSICGDEPLTARFHIAAAVILSWVDWPCCCPGKPKGYPCGQLVHGAPPPIFTDDEAEAEAAWERAERWVRTEELR